MESEELDFVQEHKKIPVTLDLTQCDDAISRQEAIEAFQIFREYESNRSNKEWIDRIETVLNQLPPVNPQPKIAHWVNGEYCSGCGCDVPAYIVDWKWQKDMNAKYCPNCGSRMVGIGDRVKFKTIGGWYNSGIIKDIDEDSYLIEVDQSEDTQIPLPYYVRVLSSLKNTGEFFVVQKDEEV